MRVKLGFEIENPTTKKAVTHVVTDSREARQGDLFFPLKGKYGDGKDYVSDALKRGAEISSLSLMEFAKLYKSRLPRLIHTVAITGSVGKTTTKEFLLRIAKKQFKAHANPENHNNEIGLPLSILSAPEDTEILILEMGTSSPGEIERLSKCAEPTVGVITNIGTAHIGAFGTREAIAKEKLSVRAALGKGRLILPYGEPLLEGVSDYLFSSTSRWARVALLSGKEGSLSLYIHGKYSLTANFFQNAPHLLECLAAACSAAHYVGVSPQNIKEGIESIDGSCVRHRLIHIGNYNILDDSYNASLESVLADLKMMTGLGFQESSLLLGDIRELGSHTENIHKEIGRVAVKYKLSRLYLFGKDAATVGEEASACGFPAERIFYNEDTDSPEITAKQIKENEGGNSVILFKASRAVRLERVRDCLSMG